MQAQQPRVWLLAACVTAYGASLSAAPVSAQDLATVDQQLTRLESDAHRLSEHPILREPIHGPTYVEERLTDGELFYRLQDYIRASIIFTDIVDNYPNHASFPDALFLLGDSLFRAGDIYGARTRFRQIIDRAADPGFGSYAQRALGRLVDIAIRTGFDGDNDVEPYFNRLSRLPSSEVEAATTYFHAKSLYHHAVPSEEVMRDSANGAVAPPGLDLDKLEQARAMFEAVQERSPYYPQARYFVGVISTLKGQFPQAIEAFQRVLHAPVSTPEHEQVAELTHVALGRLFYETDQLDQAIEQYQEIQRTSSLFDTALYELAWVFIRQGDSTRAERALEILSVASPESKYIPDGKILRGNLLLRNGRFEDANTTFHEVAVRFGPVRRELDQMIAQHAANPRGFFQDLVRQNLETFDATSFLPPLASQWVRTEGDMSRALTVVSDLATCTTLLRETRDLIEKVNAVLGSPNRVHAFADLRTQRQTSIALRNRLEILRQSVINSESRETGNGPDSAELQQVRDRRRQIEDLLGRMPRNDEDFVVRNDRVLARYRRLERSLSELQVDLMGIDARIVATNRFIQDTQAQGGVADSAGMTGELTNHRAAVEIYRKEIARIRREIELQRLQIGVGDSRYQHDAETRAEYNQLVERERQILAERGVQVAFMVPVFARIQSIETALDAKDHEIDQVAEERSAALKAQVDHEAANVETYQTTRDTLEATAVGVVGDITYANFAQVRQRFYDLVLRADVGRVDVAWADREEHRTRVEMLTRERSRDLRALDDEFREIMDDNGGASGAAAGNGGGQ